VGLDGGVDAAEQDAVAAAQFDQLAEFHGALEAHAADGDDVAEHGDAEFTEQSLGDSAHRDAGGGFAGTGALQDVACVMEVVLDGAGQVGVAGTRTG